MKLLVAGELTDGGLARSLMPGIVASSDVALVDLYGSTSSSIDNRSMAARAGRLVARRAAGKRLLEAVEQHRPDWVLLIKGRGVDTGIDRVRELGTRVACYYPDNPFWGIGDRAALSRLSQCDLALVWSQRLVDELNARDIASRVIPFGYDDRWYPLGDPAAERSGIVFLGTWSPRRERFLATLNGLDVTIRGSGWERSTAIVGGGPVYQHQAGEMLRTAAIGINLLHPQCAGAHNMRTREIAASGALQVCDPGIDGSPLRNDLECIWFTGPDDLRARVDAMLENAPLARSIAIAAQRAIADDHYRARASQIVAELEAA